MKIKSTLILLPENVLFIDFCSVHTYTHMLYKLNSTVNRVSIALSIMESQSSEICQKAAHG